MLVYYKIYRKFGINHLHGAIPLPQQSRNLVERQHNLSHRYFHLVGNMYNYVATV